MSFHQKIVRNCRNPHKGLRINTSARALHSSHRSCFESYVPPEKLTDNQMLLLEGTHPQPQKNQVSVLLRKLRHYNRTAEAEKVYERYEYMYHEVNKGDLSQGDALRVLYGLTPDDLK